MIRKKIWVCLLALTLLIQPLEILAQTDEAAGFFIAESENPDEETLGFSDDSDNEDVYKRQGYLQSLGHHLFP